MAKNIDRNEFLKVMQFPPQWESLGMYPEALAYIQIKGYESGHEEASEHDRCGAFHWWLKRVPTESELMKLMFLASIDPDYLMGEGIRKYIRKSDNYSSIVESAWTR